MLIDVAITGYRNVNKKEAEKILKCKDLITEIQRLRNVKAKVIPAVTGATGTISKSLRQFLSNILRKKEIKKLQKKKSHWALPGKFLNVVLEKNGEDQLDRSCEK